VGATPTLLPSRTAPVLRAGAGDGPTANLRTEIGVLEVNRDLLEGQKACLTAEWSRRSARPVIIARAAGELGLVAAVTPDPVIVCAGADDRGRTSIWRRAWDRLGSGQTVQAAEARTDGP